MKEKKEGFGDMNNIIQKGYDYVKEGKGLGSLYSDARGIRDDAWNTMNSYKNKGQDFLDKVDDIKDSPADGFNKILSSTIQSFNENVKKPLLKAKKDINAALNDYDLSAMDIDKVLLSEIESLMNYIDNLIDDTAGEIEKMLISMRNSFSSIISGIDIMIQNFERIICFLNEIPTRVLLLTNGVGLLFEGIANQLATIGDSNNKNTEETNKALTYSAAYVRSSFLCLLNFLKVFHKCFIYYFIDFIRRVLYLPIACILWLLQNVCKMNIKPIEDFLKTIANALDNAAYSLIKIKIFSFSEDVIKNCFTCIKVRKDVVLEQTKKQKSVLSKEIDDLIHGNKPNNGMKKIEKGKEMLSKSISFDVITKNILNGN